MMRKRSISQGLKASISVQNLSDFVSVVSRGFWLDKQDQKTGVCTFT
jgi:hypothetical protein